MTNLHLNNHQRLHLNDKNLKNQHKIRLKLIKINLKWKS